MSYLCDWGFVLWTPSERESRTASQLNNEFFVGVKHIEINTADDEIKGTAREAQNLKVYKNLKFEHN